MPSNRDRALRAAVELLGTEGLRSLTHARVDERAGLPKGSTSNHFRTRAALLDGVVSSMVDRELPEVGAVSTPDSVDGLVDVLVELYEFMTTANRTMTAARMVLVMEAAHDPALREALSRGRSVMEGVLLPALAGLGAPDPRLATQALAACFEGLFLHDLGRHGEVDARAVLGLVVRAAVGSVVA